MWRLQWNWNWHTSTRGSFLLYRFCEKWAQLQFSCYVHSPNVEQMSLRGPVVCWAPHFLTLQWHWFLIFLSPWKLVPGFPKSTLLYHLQELVLGRICSISWLCRLLLPTHMRTKLIQLGLKQQQQPQFNEYLTMCRVPFTMERHVNHLSWLPGQMISRGRYTHAQGDIQNPW